MRYEREAKALTKALAPYRNGPQGELRARVRCMLVTLMGFPNCDDIPVGIREIPHQFPRSSMTHEDRYDLLMVAHDALRELGYDAAADALTYNLETLSPTTFGLALRAKNALANLEGGPPSILLDPYPIITKSIRRYTRRDGSGGAYLVGRRVGDTWWYRFVKGKPVHNNRGDYVGWDEAAGYTFQRRGSNLEDVLSGQYGSADLRGMEVREEKEPVAVFGAPLPKVSASARAAFWRRHGR